MKSYRTICKYGYSILGEKPPVIDTDAEYIITASSVHFPYCVIIQRLDGEIFCGEQKWIVPKSSMY